MTVMPSRRNKGTRCWPCRGTRNFPTLSISGREMENTTDSLATQQPLIDATEQIRSANIEKLKELMARGMLDPQFDTMMIAAKIDLLIEFAVGASVR